MDIRLNHTRQVAVVDADMEAVMRAYSWQINPSGYAVTKTPRGAFLSMHKLVSPPPPGLTIDHINRNRLDNRRCNLRHATREEQAANRVCKRRINHDLQRTAGVYPRTRKDGTIVFRASFKGKHLGTYKTVDEASKARDDAGRASTVCAFVVYNST